MGSFNDLKTFGKFILSLRTKAMAAIIMRRHPPRTLLHKDRPKLEPTGRTTKEEPPKTTWWQPVEKQESMLGAAFKP